MKRTLLGVLMLSCMIFTGCAEKGSVQKSIIKVETEAVASSAAFGSQGYSGTIEEENGVSLSFSNVGTVERIMVSEGDMVKKGQLIATIDPASVRNSYNALLASRKQAEDAYRRMKQLHDNGSLPEIQWVEVQSKLEQAVSAEQIAKKSLNDCSLYAPFSGYIFQKQAEMGQNVMPGVTIVKLVSIENVKVKVFIPENEISKFNRGQEVKVSVSALGNRVFTGRIKEKGVSADPMSRSYEVNALLRNTDHALLPGMVCEMYAFTDQEQSEIMLPADIIQVSFDNRYFVWTAVNGKAHKAYVTLGENVGAKVVIRSGLNQGDQVITKGQQKVCEGMDIKS